MLAFIDESGDSGFKPGSSDYFTVALIVFEDLDEAKACDQRIQLLKKELGKATKWEFHFKDNSQRIRKSFLTAVLPYNFFYYGIVLNKNKLYGEGFKNKESFYKYTCSLVFENAKDKLSNAIVLIDESGNRDFRISLSKYLKQRSNNNDQSIIKKVKMQKFPQQ